MNEQLASEVERIDAKLSAAPWQMWGTQRMRPVGGSQNGSDDICHFYESHEHCGPALVELRNLLPAIAAALRQPASRVESAVEWRHGDNDCRQANLGGISFWLIPISKTRWFIRDCSVRVSSWPFDAADVEAAKLEALRIVREAVLKAADAWR